MMYGRLASILVAYTLDDTLWLEDKSLTAPFAFCYSGFIHSTYYVFHAFLTMIIVLEISL
jgi:hypothetical protein